MTPPIAHAGSPRLTFENDLQIARVDAGQDTVLITVCAERRREETAAELLSRAELAAQAGGAWVIQQFIFGGIDPVTRQADPGIVRAVTDRPWPVVWIQGDGNPDARLSGTQLVATTLPPGRRPRAVRTASGTLALTYEDGHARHTRVGGILPDPGHGCPSEAQTTAAFATLDTLLRHEGTDLGAVARTWIYLDRLLRWYGPFNTARTAFFRERNLFARNIPSSTGIGAINAAASAIQLSAYAVTPLTPDDRVTSLAVPSPLQCAALDYRSSFSRAHVITHPHYRQLLVSGTASITPDGASAHPDDIDAQIELTMRVVASIYAAEGFDWADTTRAIAYFKNDANRERLVAWHLRHGVPRFPTSVVRADVCRDELLFEIEIDAMRAR